MTTIQVVGRVKGTPVLKTGKEKGTKYLKLEMCDNHRAGTKTVTTWYEVTFFGKDAEILDKYKLQPGETIQVAGRFVPEDYENPETGKVSRTNTITNAIWSGLRLPKQDKGNASNETTAAVPEQATAQVEAEPASMAYAPNEVDLDEDEETPF